MSLFEIAAILLTVTAIGSFINDKWLKIPVSIALLIFAMCFGIIGIILKKIGLINIHYIEIFLSNIDFKETVFHGMLSFLLFAGALQINIEDLKASKVPIAITATVSTIISTLIIGSGFYVLSNWLGFTIITFLYAMLFGTILSPTDPIAALSIIRKMKTSKEIETTIIGESLFNDGIAIVFFLTILELVNKNVETSFMSVMHLLILEIGGGILFGGVLGYIAYQMLRHTNSFQVELFITLSVATGGYVLAEKLSLSAPLAMVVAGIIIGNHGRWHAMSDESRKHIDAFWEAIDEILNSVLFILIGLEMIVINPTITVAILAVCCIFLALIARYVSVAIPLILLKSFYSINPGTIFILTWGGLRGALSIAMVLALSAQPIKEIFLPCIYFVVIFSIAVQGLTLKRLLSKS